MKFYTDDGNWDLVGNNTPIFFIRDPILVSIVAHHTAPSWIPGVANYHKLINYQLHFFSFPALSTLRKETLPLT
jgi:catalase